MPLWLVINPLFNIYHVGLCDNIHKERISQIISLYIISYMFNGEHGVIQLFRKPHTYIIYSQRLAFVFLATLGKKYMRCILFYLAFWIEIKETIFWFMVSNIFHRHFHRSDTTYFIQLISNFHCPYFFLAKVET